jgi:predicted amidophosphoribosyltransferase
MAAPLARGLIGLAAPPHCAACGAALAADAVLCLGCEAGMAAALPVVEPGPPAVSLAVAASGFDGTARRIVHGLKYSRRLGLAPVAARAMLAALPPRERHGSVVPVPAAPWRRRWRGFDPAEEIAIAIARLAGLELSDCLSRARGPRQVGRRRSERLGDPPRVWADGQVPEDVLLVDDVCTTGATISACARALTDAGCRRVVAMTLARALPAAALAPSRVEA